MATFITKQAQILIAGVDLSDHMTNIELSLDTGSVDATAMGTTAVIWQNNLPAITSWQVTADLLQDEAAGKVGATLWAVMGLVTSIEIRPVNAARSSTNPAYYGSAMLKTYPILAGGPGDLAKSKVVFVGSGLVQRLTS